MDHVIDVSQTGPEPTVLTETGGGGLIGSGLLADRPLAVYLDDHETAEYVLRNAKRGVELDFPAAEETVEPGGDYSALALVTDVRVLFAVGGSADREESSADAEDGFAPESADASADWTRSVPLADVVDVRTVEGGFRGDTFVLETVDDTTYRFACRGDLDPVREFTDAAVGIWTRAERRLERAAETVDRIGEAFEAGDVDVVLAAVEDVTDRLAEAREAASALAGSAAVVGERADEIGADAAALERRAHAERAEQARERAHTRWDDHEFERAYDHFGTALESYERALATDADRPTDDLLEQRRATLSVECDRLAEAPRDRAEHAADLARSAEDPETAADRWGAAVERYEELLALDWGREQPRFEGDREAAREALATAASRLVEAHCDRAREALEGAANPTTEPAVARGAVDRAEAALADAREVARERAPDASDEVEAVAAAIDDRRETLASVDPPTADADGGVVTDRPTPIVDRDADDAESGVAGDEIDDAEDETDGAEDETEDETDDVDGESGDAAESADASVDPAAVNPGRFPAFVAALFRDHGWSTAVFDGGGDRKYDLIAEADGPVGVTVCVWTAHPDEVEAVDAATIERYAASLDRTEEADVAALVSAAPLSATARERATDHDVRVLDADGIAAECDRCDRDSLPGVPE